MNLQITWDLWEASTKKIRINTIRFGHSWSLIWSPVIAENKTVSLLAVEVFPWQHSSTKKSLTKSENKAMNHIQQIENDSFCL